MEDLVSSPPLRIQRSSLWNTHIRTNNWTTCTLVQPKMPNSTGKTPQSSSLLTSPRDVRIGVDVTSLPMVNSSVLFLHVTHLQSQRNYIGQLVKSVPFLDVIKNTIWNNSNLLMRRREALHKTFKFTIHWLVFRYDQLPWSTVRPH